MFSLILPVTCGLDLCAGSVQEGNNGMKIIGFESVFFGYN